MAESMYKGMLGWSVEDDKHPGTHKLLTNDEYRQLLEEIEKAKQEKETAKKEADKIIQLIESDAANDIAEIEKSLQASINAFGEKLNLAEKEVLYQKNLNANLLRISRERANADRKLKPKKEHTGYVVISSQEKEIHYKQGKQQASYVVWETVLQSPYSIEFTEEQARTQIINELLTNDGGWKLGDIGISSCCMTKFEDLVAKYPKEIKTSNMAYNERLRANYKVGYWEYIILHTLPLGPVPKEMLP